MKPTTRFRTLALGVPLLIAVTLTVIAAVMARGHRGELATHFASDGTPDGFDSPTAFLLVVGVTTIGTAALMGALAGTRQRFLAGCAGFTATFLGALEIRTVHVNLAAPSPQDARLPAIEGLLFLVLSVAVGALLAWAATPVPRESDGERVTAVVPVSGARRAVWFGHATARPWLIALTVGIGAVFTAIGLLIPDDTGGADRVMIGSGVVLVIVGMMFTRVRVRVDHRGLTWSLWPGLIRSTIPHEKITGVRAIDLDPGEWGGWGWRLSARGTALVLRGGPAIVLSRRTAADFAVTVDDADTGAGLVRGYLDALREEKES
ncbi:hypothetical protein [Corynebacterium pygosceleis]|uniref:DUF1648 domain-containing protein n=1 Tax=Corynebacterium pygosceleis TaxID=2800406 RepID=A0A9Q4C8N4_9CORY|nr:hypothetical protein [Corynebacterium pygosceleis]MCK7636736.1 hypothetical protein [Corynebacterium pygosceleis]MCL0120476.1 hypothetical protein [Corynebacterium pygosceleis]MCX7467490.1 hypothetical protein [Corynebacterium pygosceleis]